MTSRYHYYPAPWIEGSEHLLVHGIFADQIQEFAIGNFDRFLTEEELEMLPFGFAEAWECDFWAEAIENAISMAAADQAFEVKV